VVGSRRGVEIQSDGGNDDGKIVRGIFMSGSGSEGSDACGSAGDHFFSPIRNSGPLCLCVRKDQAMMTVEGARSERRSRRGRRRSQEGGGLFFNQGAGGGEIERHGGDVRPEAAVAIGHGAGEVEAAGEGDVAREEGGEAVVEGAGAFEFKIGLGGGGGFFRGGGGGRGGGARGGIGG
jgi:hypothetical protein